MPAGALSTSISITSLAETTQSLTDVLASWATNVSSIGCNAPNRGEQLSHRSNECHFSGLSFPRKTKRS
jgi:hypothetical protein